MSDPATPIFKYHGIGNDFVVVDVDTASLLDLPRLAPEICDRHRGVGADGVIVVDTTANAGGFDARIAIFNRDGSRPQMCGNGIRCVARHLVEQGGLGHELRIATDAGTRSCVVYSEGDRWEVDVDMGAPHVGEPLTWGSAGWTLHLVDMGNPHAVVFETPDLDVVDESGRQLNGPSSPFHQGVNVEFVRVAGDSRLDVVVYERGVGRTQACGTGACAAAVAAWATARVGDHPVEVALPGGALQIRREGEHIWMRGETVLVMQGELAAGWLRARTK